MNIKIKFIGLTIFSTLFVPFSVSAERDSLILGVHPFLSNDAIIKKFSPLAKYLTKQTGIDIKVRVGSSYDEHIQYVGLNKVDIAFMGPASYVNMVNTYENKPILARLEVKGVPYFKGNIIARKDSNIKTLKGLKGKRIAFGDPNSTMSYIVPHHILHKAGVFKNRLTKHEFLHSHTNVVLGVLSGDYDAGAVKPSVFKKFEDKGLVIIAETPKISEHLFVVRSNLSTNKINALRTAMLNIKKSKKGMSALKAIKNSITNLVAATSNDYANLRKIIIETEKIH